MTRVTSKKVKGNLLNGGFPLYLRKAIILAIMLVALTVITLPSCTPATPVETDGLKCAIVDQLYSVEPNQVFIDQLTQQMEGFGFTVDIYQGDEVNVALYRSLPTRGYKLIIFRVHGGLLENETGIGDKIWLFTSQPYSRMTYFIAQLRDQVRAAGISSDTAPVFAISTKFVTDCMKGDFSNTVIINMACAAFHTDEMAKAFVQKGASAYLAWDVSVGLRYVDNATMALVEKLLTEELTIQEAVAQTMQEKGPDPNNHAYLYYYPATSADKTVRELVE